MGQPVVHWEIAADDAKKLQDFYSGLFEWKIDSNNPMNYGMVETGGEGGISGGIYDNGGDKSRTLTFYVQVDDLEAYLKKAEKLGGKRMTDPTPIPGTGRAIAHFTDPGGNPVGLFKPETGQA
ncbi:MAG: VOC family protein [Nitrospinota bacterium]